MNTFLLTIVFFASAANAEFKTQLEVADAVSCEMLAARWQPYREGMLRVLSVQCDAKRDPPNLTVRVAKPGDLVTLVL